MPQLPECCPGSSCHQISRLMGSSAGQIWSVELHLLVCWAAPQGQKYSDKRSGGCHFFGSRGKYQCWHQIPAQWSLKTGGTVTSSSLTTVSCTSSSYLHILNVGDENLPHCTWLKSSFATAPTSPQHILS